MLAYPPYTPRLSSGSPSFPELLSPDPTSDAGGELRYGEYSKLLEFLGLYTVRLPLNAILD